MITTQELERLARGHHAGVFPNIVREYFQHLFLQDLYQLPNSERLLFKGGTALRIIYGSPRFSEDLDFSLIGASRTQAASFVEGLFVSTLASMERIGCRVELGAKSAATSGGYFGVAAFEMPGFRPVGVEINVSARGVKVVRGEVDGISNDFVPTYTLVHMPEKDLVEEKIFGALRERKKPRDFYDLYFMMRKGMLSSDQKARLAGAKREIMADAKKINFRRELSAFLPLNQQAIIRDFMRALEAEIGRQTA